MEKNKYKNKQGSILIGVIIIFLMISSLSVAIISRSLQGTILTTDSKKGYIAYQNSDKNTENFLNSFKTLDNKVGEKKIPENTQAISFCSGGSATCSNADEGTLFPTNTVADIFSFKAVGDQNQGVTRAISAPVPERINGKLVANDLKITSCNGTNCGTSFNSCDTLVKLDPANFDSNTMKNYEVRKSTSPLLSYGLDNNTLYGWQKVIGLAVGDYFDASHKSTVIKNGDSNLLPTNGNLQAGGQYGRTYFFSFKARNKNPFTLDSLYFNNGGNTPISIDMPGGKACTGVGASGKTALTSLNCIRPGTQPIGTTTFDAPYSCCNGTECYMPDPNWTHDPVLNCALQTCNGSPDSYAHNPSPNSSSGNGIASGLGWCGSTVNCAEGTTCAQPFRVVGYCSSAPSSSTQSSFFSNTAWTLNNSVDVNRNDGQASMQTPIDNIDNRQPRCSYHNSPGSVANNQCGSPTGGSGSFSASLSSSSEATCGPYTASVSCNLSCNSNFYVAETGAVSTSNQVTVSYTNNCCYENCPTDKRTKACTSGSCKGVCGGFSDTRTEWDKSCTDISCPSCGVATHCTPDCKGSTSNNGSSCNPVYYCPPEPSCDCGYSGSCSGFSCSSPSGPTDTRECYTPVGWGTIPPDPTGCACGVQGRYSNTYCGGVTGSRTCVPTKTCTTPTCSGGKTVKGTCNVCTGSGLYCG